MFLYREAHADIEVVFVQEGALADRSTTTLDRHLKNLQRGLGLLPSQHGPWGDFAAAFRANAERFDGVQAPVEGKVHMLMPTALDNLDQVYGPLQHRLAALSTMRATSARLYDVLTPRQRRQADRIFPLYCLVGIAASGVHRMQSAARQRSQSCAATFEHASLAVAQPASGAKL